MTTTAFPNNVSSIRLKTTCVTLLLLLYASAAADGTTPRQEVTSLPGWGAPPTKHYSGFVEVDIPSSTHLHYYLIESQSSPSTDPLFLWMNGGPGASSLAGIFSENGPLLLTEDGASLMLNPYSWNRAANLLAIEFAPGIGYSYCGNSTSGNFPDFCPKEKAKQGACSPCLASDSSVAKQNAIVLESLLGDPTLFPELAGRPLYLLGESYAGVYLPTLAAEIISRHKDTKLINLHGIWATDPCMDNEAQFGWLDLGVSFAYQKGLISRGVYDTLADSPSSRSPCVSGRTRVGDRTRKADTDMCRRAWRLYDLATAGIGDAVHPAELKGLPMYIDPLNAYGVSGGPNLPAWLGSSAVRAAFHTQSSPNDPYLLEIGNNGYDQYTLEYAACNDNAVEGAPSMVDVYQQLAKEVARGGAAANLRRVMILNGDIDPVVDMHGTEAAVMKMRFPVAKGEDRRPWFFNSSASAAALIAGKPIAWGPTLHTQEAGAQVGGFVAGFDTGGPMVLQFVTVRDSGHMTPAYGPQKTFHTVYHALVKDRPLAPLLPHDFATASDATFYGTFSAAGTFAAWVGDATAAPFLLGEGMN